MYISQLTQSMPPPATYKSEIGSQSTMCQVHTGSYVSPLAPGKTDYNACHPRKTTTYILHVVPITTHTHDRRKSIGKMKQKIEKKIKGRKEKTRKLIVGRIDFTVFVIFLGAVVVREYSAVLLYGSPKSVDGSVLRAFPASIAFFARDKPSPKRDCGVRLYPTAAIATFVALRSAESRQSNFRRSRCC